MQFLALPNGYRYKGIIRDDNFHGYGILELAN